MREGTAGAQSLLFCYERGPSFIYLCRKKLLNYLILNFKFQIFKLKPLLIRFPVYARLLIFTGYLAGIVYASLASPRQMPRLMYIPHLDKVVHLLMYLGFSFLGLWVLNTGLVKQNLSDVKRKNGWLNYLFIAFVAANWGLFMEIMQRYMHTGRHYSVYDLHANITGVFLGSLIYYLIVRKR